MMLLSYGIHTLIPTHIECGVKLFLFNEGQFSWCGLRIVRMVKAPYQTPLVSRCSTDKLLVEVSLVGQQVLHIHTSEGFWEFWYSEHCSVDTTIVQFISFSALKILLIDLPSSPWTFWGHSITRIRLIRYLDVEACLCTQFFFFPRDGLTHKVVIDTLVPQYISPS